MANSGSGAIEGSDTEPHRRHNPLNDEWVIVSPQRTQRPWQGSEAEPHEMLPSYDTNCYLCPGNERAGDVANPNYSTTFVFDNDFPALTDSGAGRVEEAKPTAGLFSRSALAGACRVVCFSPRHDLTLADMSVADVEAAIGVLTDEFAELSERYRYVQIFETRGEICGSSNPHPHGQIWSTDFLPAEVASESKTQADYQQTHGTPMLLDYAESEIERGERVVELNEHWVVVVPYWAYWPYETLVLPRRNVQRLTELTVEEQGSLASITSRMLRRFDRLFDTPFPYRSGWHNAPTGDDASSGWQLHAHYYPPLLRSATVPKVPASYEWLAARQRDLTPELAAEHLAAITL